MKHIEINARNLLCPMPVIRCQDGVKTLQQGDILTIYCTDPGAMNDIPAWCRINGHKVITMKQNDLEIQIQVEVGKEP